MELTFKIEEANNGFVINFKDKKFLARSTVEVGRILVNLLTNEEFYNLKRNKQTRS